MAETDREAAEKKKKRKTAAAASLVVSFLLVAAKLGAYFYTGSVAILSSLLDSTVDVLASSMTAFGVAKAAQPPDRDHRYGHAKAESLAALAQAAFIVGSSIFLSLEAVGRFSKPVPVEHMGVGYAVMGVSVVATLVLLAFQTRVVRETGSLAISADRMHYASDVLINIGVVLSLLIQQTGGYVWADPCAALFIAAFMIYGAARIGRKALAVLMDEELPEEDRARLLILAESVSGVWGAHDLRTRSDSERPIIEIHIEMDPQLTLAAAHEIVERVEKAIRAAYANADVLIHQDPAGVKEKRLDDMIEKNETES